LVSLLIALPGCTKMKRQKGNSSCIDSVVIRQSMVPLHGGTDNNLLFELMVHATAGSAEPLLNKITVNFTDESGLNDIESLIITCQDEGSDTTSSTVFGEAVRVRSKTNITGSYYLGSGVNTLRCYATVKTDPDLLSRFAIKNISLAFKKCKPVNVSPDSRYIYRPVTILRAQGQDNVDTYRIPGLITTGKGTLIAVYDNRYNNSKDLQENIDIGMSRSTDGGKTWQPMRVIMNMGEYGGRSQRLNGTGDPSVLYDSMTNTIWVAALWMSGASENQMLWWASGPGMTPEETGQFMLVRSTDDGVTWSDPINITPQIKDPAWQLLLQGPGRGIMTTDGTLVFPAQFKADIGVMAIDGGRYTCHSTIVYSKDHGQTWHTGTGARANTTESQVVELTNGSLMLNMRDDHNRTDKGTTNGRAVAVTDDMGETWTMHQSSNSLLQEPNCQASIISADLVIDGKRQMVLFFSNPNSKTNRNHMTIKASLDQGLTWPEEYQTELNAADGYGYSCMTMTDDHTIGIVYEGIKELYFQKVPVSDILGDLVKE